MRQLFQEYRGLWQAVRDDLDQWETLREKIQDVLLRIPGVPDHVVSELSFFSPTQSAVDAMIDVVDWCIAQRGSPPAPESNSDGDSEDAIRRGAALTP